MANPLTLTFSKDNGKFEISEKPVRVQHGQTITFVNACDCNVNISGPKNPFADQQSWPGDLPPGASFVSKIESLDTTVSNADVAVDLTFHFTAVFSEGEGITQGNTTTLQDDIIIAD